MPLRGERRASQGNDILKGTAGSVKKRQIVLEVDPGADYYEAEKQLRQLYWVQLASNHSAAKENMSRTANAGWSDHQALQDFDTDHDRDDEEKRTRDGDDDLQQDFAYEYSEKDQMALDNVVMNDSGTDDVDQDLDYHQSLRDIARTNTSMISRQMKYSHNKMKNDRMDLFGGQHKGSQFSCNSSMVQQTHFRLVDDDEDYHKALHDITFSPRTGGVEYQEETPFSFDEHSRHKSIDASNTSEVPAQSAIVEHRRKPPVMASASSSATSEGTSRATDQSLMQNSTPETLVNKPSVPAIDVERPLTDSILTSSSVIRAAETVTNSTSASGGYVIGAAIIGATGAVGLAASSIAKLLLVDRPAVRNEERKADIALLKLRITKIVEDLKAELQLEEHRKNAQLHERHRQKEQELKERAESIARIECQHMAQSRKLNEQLKALETPAIELNQRRRQQRLDKQGAHWQDGHVKIVSTINGKTQDIPLQRLSSRADHERTTQPNTPVLVGHEECEEKMRDLERTLDRARNSLAEYETQIADLRKVVDDAEAKREISESKHRKLHEEHEEVKTQVHELNAALAKTQQHRDLLQTSASIHRDRAKQLHNQTLSISQELDNLAGSLETFVGPSTWSLVSGEGQGEDALSKLRWLRRMFELEVLKEHGALKAELEDLKCDLMIAEEQVSEQLRRTSHELTVVSHGLQSPEDSCWR